MFDSRKRLHVFAVAWPPPSTGAILDYFKRCCICWCSNSSDDLQINFLSFPYTLSVVSAAI